MCGCGANVFGFIIIRTFYISRLLMTIPSTRGSMQACIQTVKQSARLLYMLLFFATLALLINSSVIYYLERGEYHDSSKVHALPLPRPFCAVLDACQSCYACGPSRWCCAPDGMPGAIALIALACVARLQSQCKLGVT